MFFTRGIDSEHLVDEVVQVRKRIDLAERWVGILSCQTSDIFPEPVLYFWASSEDTRAPREHVR